MQYELWLGQFDKDDFIWKTIKKFDNYKDADEYYNKFIKSIINMNGEDIVEEYGSRLDIELRFDEKKIKWLGLYENIIKPDEK